MAFEQRPPEKPGPESTEKSRREFLRLLSYGVGGFVAGSLLWKLAGDGRKPEQREVPTTLEIDDDAHPMLASCGISITERGFEIATGALPSQPEYPILKRWAFKTAASVRVHFYPIIGKLVIITDQRDGARHTFEFELDHNPRHAHDCTFKHTFLPAEFLRKPTDGTRRPTR